MGYPIISNDALNTDELRTHDLWHFVTMVEGAVKADPRAYTDTTNGAMIYIEISDTQPSSSVAVSSLLYLADSGANFPTLDSDAAPAVIGSVIYAGNAGSLIVQEVPTSLITSATMTAGVVSKYGASNTGISVSKNICTSISCTGLDLVGGTATSTFWLHTLYKSI